jgi:hypothetical protein
MKDSDGEGAGGGVNRSHPSNNLSLPAPYSDPNLQFSGGTDDESSNRDNSSSATGGASPRYYSDYPSSFSGECSSATGGAQEGKIKKNLLQPSRRPLVRFFPAQRVPARFF